VEKNERQVQDQQSNKIGKRYHTETGKKEQEANIMKEKAVNLDQNKVQVWRRTDDVINSILSKREGRWLKNDERHRTCLNQEKVRVQ